MTFPAGKVLPLRCKSVRVFGEVLGLRVGAPAYRNHCFVPGTSSVVVCRDAQPEPSKVLCEHSTP